MTYVQSAAFMPEHGGTDSDERRYDTGGARIGPENSSSDYVQFSAI